MKLLNILFLCLLCNNVFTQEWKFTEIDTTSEGANMIVSISPMPGEYYEIYIQEDGIWVDTIYYFSQPCEVVFPYFFKWDIDYKIRLKTDDFRGNCDGIHNHIEEIEWKIYKPVIPDDPHPTDTMEVDNPKPNVLEVCKPIEVLFPNAISPNNDGTNDILTSYPEGLQFRIFDRWGNRLYYGKEWNPGLVVASGVYVIVWENCKIFSQDLTVIR